MAEAVAATWDPETDMVSHECHAVAGEIQQRSWQVEQRGGGCPLCERELRMEEPTNG